MGTKVYGATSIGPHCKIGGEVNNVVFFGYSNKGHDGFLGNAVVGEWCNLGADTNASNLKNTYGNVEVYSYETDSYVASNEQFVGLCMGDHSKSGINTMFNTGTVVGVSCNVYGAEFPPKHIPSFSWGGASGCNDYLLKRVIQHANNMMSRRGLALSDEDIAIFEYLFGKK
jgi:UDP-N-acetylglucosamine diphosphorylase/glucosamine-1-phosphate N-acetyltransferase